MSATRHHIFSAPFDAVAKRYDETFTSSLIGQAQRAAVWSELQKTFLPGQRILEIGCGTGVDACMLAQRGIEVVACDSSPEMIEVTTRRVQVNSLQKFVEPRVLRAEDLSTLRNGAQFDGAFSNFGTLNCVEDLKRLAANLSRLLKPGATGLLCWMGPCCLWEMVWYLTHGNRSKAFRRMSRDGVTARITDGAFVHVRYPSLRSLARTFAPEFQVKSVKGIGVAVPPSYVEPWAKRNPDFLRLCEKLDSLIGLCPGIRQLGDHVLVRLQRSSSIVAVQ